MKEKDKYVEQDKKKESSEFSKKRKIAYIFFEEFYVTGRMQSLGHLVLIHWRNNKNTGYPYD